MPASTRDQLAEFIHGTCNGGPFPAAFPGGFGADLSLPGDFLDGIQSGSPASDQNGTPEPAQGTISVPSA